MNFNRHSEFEGKHAVFAASQPSWLNYDLETMLNRYKSSFSEKIGTIIHDYAHECIKYGIKSSNTAACRRALCLELLRKGIPDFAINEDQWFLTFNEFVNDAIGYRMESEKVLLYSDRFFGTADAISFYKNKLQVHDLKTGVRHANIDQLKIYASYFCLEYGVNPKDIDIILRIYQANDIIELVPEVDEITEIMNKVISFDKELSAMR